MSIDNISSFINLDFSNIYSKLEPNPSFSFSNFSTLIFKDFISSLNLLSSAFSIIISLSRLVISMLICFSFSLVIFVLLSASFFSIYNLSISAFNNSIFSLYSFISLFLDNILPLTLKLPPVKDPPGFNISPSNVTTLNLWLFSLANFIALSILSIIIVLPSIFFYYISIFVIKLYKSLAIPIKLVPTFIFLVSILLDLIIFIGKNVTLPKLFFFK